MKKWKKYILWKKTKERRENDEEKYEAINDSSNEKYSIEEKYEEMKIIV